MKSIIKVMILLISITTLVACQTREKEVVVNKDGQLHEVSDSVRFYYPSGYEMSTATKETFAIANEELRILEFKKDMGTFFYTGIDDPTENVVEEKEVLLVASMEENGATINMSQEVELESGITVLKVAGKYESNGIQFMLVAYFEEETTHILGYYSNIEEYEENIHEVSEFLETLTVESITN